jgi:glutaconyl-CoA/methylmalonyl-CoA decarboxylase subunit gamma
MDNHKVNVSVNGTNYLVEIEDLSTEVIQVKVNGRSYEVQVSRADQEITPSGSSLSDPEETTETRLRTGAQSGSSFGSNSEVRAPMPGTILAISVKVGDAVKRGQQLCALEAMKMKSAIRSSRDGVIGGVEVKEGMKVAYRDLLFRFE